jgi:hypothetical protein
MGSIGLRKQTETQFGSGIFVPVPFPERAQDNTSHIWRMISMYSTFPQQSK